MSPSGRLLAAGLAAAAILGVVLAVMQLEPPSVVHRRHLDTSRVQRLMQIEMQIENSARTTKHLPARLEDLWADNAYDRDSFLDPESGLPVEYHVVNENSFELCATFLTASKEDSELAYMNNWRHPMGHFCFLRHIAQP